MEEYVAAAQHHYRLQEIAPRLQRMGPLQHDIEALERARRAACRRGPVGWAGLQMVNMAVWFGQLGARVADARVDPESAA
ncbi:MAG TPA: hypothetical protein VFA70_00605 [Dehalococcoidia bacterium]|nr:hypothetical protein [Dehalococcoidia bacterium]